MRGDFPDLVSTGAVAYRKRIAMGVSKQADPVLLHLLDKEIRCMGPDVTDAYFAQPEVIAATYGREAIVKILRRLGE